jgi:hypothetical protein
MRHGQGILEFAPGEKYIGQFANNKFHGKGMNWFFLSVSLWFVGTYYYPNGLCIEAIFTNGKITEILRQTTSGTSLP